MAKIAVIEDDLPMSNQLKGLDRIRASRALRSTSGSTATTPKLPSPAKATTLVVLDIELGRERHAGVAIINAINKQRQGTPVLVVSAMPAAIYRSIMKALDAWDYLQKTTFEEADFIETFLDILRSVKDKPGARRPCRQQAPQPGTAARPAAPEHAIWRGQRVNLPLTAQRILAALHRAARRGGLLRRPVPRRQKRPQPRQHPQARQHHTRCLQGDRRGLRRH
jgi:DNA-binding response OmpR family regulator